MKKEQMSSVRGLYRVFMLFLLIGSWGTGIRAADNILTPEEIQEGWILLFDGESLFGWEEAAEIIWRVEGGSIIADRGEVGLLVTRTDFSNYRLKLKFRSEAETNSGIFLRTAPVCADAAPGGSCYEVNIAPPSHPFPTGSLVGRERAVQGVKDPTGWHQLEIWTEGNRTEIWIDGRRTLGYTATDSLERGRIGLQHNQGRVEFRDIKLLPLGFRSLFSGQDLDGWQILAGRESEFHVTDEEELQILDGPGQIETEGSFEDFVLQLDVRMNGRGLNSGVFFRSLPGQFWVGYESQLQNVYEGGDPTKPVDYGTGGIYNRIPARRIVSYDEKWFTKTIIATEDRFGVWVDGYPVTSWTDTRSPHENPREGLRLQEGTISLQGHDPTTNLLFRNIRISELP